MNKELLNLLTQALPYVYGAYECAFPDQDANFDLAARIEKAIADNGGAWPFENQTSPRYYKNPEFSHLPANYIEPNIEGIPLRSEHIGLYVTYIPLHAKGLRSHPDVEQGIISSWNDHGVFVHYNGNPRRTNFEDLVWSWRSSC